MNKKLTVILLLISLNVGFVFGQTNYTQKFDAVKMKELVKRLSADDFEGRGPGNEGGKRAAQYIADQLKAIGAKPANKGSYFQNVKLFGTKTAPATILQIENKNAKAENYKFADDWVGFTDVQKADVSIDSEIVFMGYGIDAPLYKWNDYKGAADYRG